MNLFEWRINYSFNSYYEDCCKILKIEKYHNESILKDAYHKKVLETHPDKGGKTEDFIKVNEAYKFLNSLIMDKPKVSKFRDSFPNNKKYFQENDNFEQKKKKISISISKLNKNNNKYEKNKNKSKNVTYKLEIELSDAYFGARKIIKLNRNRICKKCSENNLLNETNLNCEECNGKKYSSQIKEVQLIIKPGTYDGCKVTFKGEGDEYIGYEPGDIIFEIIVKENKNYLRKGSDLYMYKNITIGESLGMDIILINLFDKVKFYVNKNKILINPEETMTIIGKGFPFFDDNKHRGNLHIKFHFSFPPELNLEQKNIIKNVFEGNYKQYIKSNEFIELNKKNNTINNTNKYNIKKINLVLNKKIENCNKKYKKFSYAPKIFNLRTDNKKQNEKLNNQNYVKKSKSDINKSFNKNPDINLNKNEKENKINNIELYDLVKFDEKFVNKGYFFNKNKK